MSAWRVNEDPPEDFLQLLYDEEDVSEGDLSVDEEDDEIEHPSLGQRMSPVPGAVSSRSDSLSPRPMSPSPAFSPWPPREERARSRSPIWPRHTSQSEPSGVVIRINDQDGTPLEPQEPTKDISESDFLVPDAHINFVPPPEQERSEQVNVRVRGRSERRGRRRGGRVQGVRGRSARGRVRQNRGSHWATGHPLTEIWMTDDDVPPELINLARDVIRTRERRHADSDTSEDDDIFVDAEDGVNPYFEWSSMESFEVREEPFLPERTGSVRVHNSAYDAFRCYWDEGILSRIVRETNLYATKIASISFQQEWYETNIHEILCLFAFWMMIGIIKMPTITSCFSLDPLMKTEIFRKIFTYRRYTHLVRALGHFVELDPAGNEAYPATTEAGRNLDRLHRLRPIIDDLNAKFQAEYVLDKDICIDESLTLWKGRLDIKQYIRSKAAKFGIKTFELCESATGYLWSFLVYTGKQPADVDQVPGVLKSTSIVKKLMTPLLNKGYRLFMDNWYNSPLLARFLKSKGTDCVGTLRPSRRDVPVLINKAPLRKGEFVARHSGDMSVLAWQDKKRITMISTCHGSAVGLPRVLSRQPSRPIAFKPQSILDYNRFMGGVDLKDQMLEPYLLERKRCAKWYMKLFKRLLNVSILNSKTLLKSSTKKQYNHLAFRLQLVDAILSKHLSLCPLSRKHNVNSSSHLAPSRIVPPVYEHWPTSHEQQSEASAAHGRSFRKRCVVCLREGRKSQKTTFACETCKVPLCIKRCFKSYHTSSFS